MVWVSGSEVSDAGKTWAPLPPNADFPGYEATGSGVAGVAPVNFEINFPAVAATGSGSAIVAPLAIEGIPAIGPAVGSGVARPAPYSQFLHGARVDYAVQTVQGNVGLTYIPIPLATQLVQANVGLHFEPGVGRDASGYVMANVGASPPAFYLRRPAHGWGIPTVLGDEFVSYADAMVATATVSANVTT
jgi:hypothetical protein